MSDSKKKLLAALVKDYPLPWKVAYYRRCPEWDEKTRPFVICATGNEVIETTAMVGHPGEYDEIADNVAHFIVMSANEFYGKELGSDGD